MSNRFHVSRADYEAEQTELQTLQDRLNYVSQEMDRIQERYNQLWSQNKRLARAIKRPRATERFYEERAQNLTLSAIERYISGETARRLRKERITPLRQEQEKIIAELWQIISQRAPLRAEIAALSRKIRDLTDLIKRKVVSELRRVELNLYVIIEERVKVYERAYAPGEKRSHGKTVKRYYPKGRFQCIYQIDAFVEPNTDTVLSEQDPLRYFLDPASRNNIIQDAIDHLFEYFTVSFVPHQFTIGVTSLMAPKGDRGRPPKIISVARSVEGLVPSGASPQKSWGENLDEFIMSQLEYNAIIEPMTEYVEELKRLKSYQGGLA